MVGNTLDLTVVPEADRIAVEISNQYNTWNNQRNKWLADKRELRNYVFATDTRTTSNSTNPWKNSTTLPKLCQIRDNLHANYMAALFPHSDWLRWEGQDRVSESFAKRRAITAYMRNKTNQSKLQSTVSDLLFDWIDYGNVFAQVEYVDLSKEVDGEVIPGYVGPRLKRISPEEIVFNPLASSFEEAPKIIRSLKSLGELKKAAEDNDPIATEMYKKAVNNSAKVRQAYSEASESDLGKIERYKFDGFGTLKEYYGSGYVEILTFHGDYYNTETGELLRDHRIQIMDKKFVISIEPNPSWLSYGGIRHVGWRKRQDNLYAMGPLDNLVGLQYRIDHLENLKADVFDLYAFPVRKIRGFVEEFTYEPNADIHVGEDGDVDFMRPDFSALNADNQIQQLEFKMEELAGAPRMAMGLRTPGEKTAFEVSTLADGANRIFVNKTQYFESNFFEPLLNDMLEISRRNLDGADLIRITDNDTSAALFAQITKEDITAKGRLYPRGSSRYTRKAMQTQNLVQLYNTVGADPDVRNHLSAKTAAKVMEELLELDDFELYSPNIRIAEQTETQEAMMAAQRQLESQQQAITTADESDLGLV